MLRQRVLINTILKRKFHALPQSQTFVITPEIQQAIKQQGPVVALESTIISHGNLYSQQSNNDFLISGLRYAISTKRRDCKSSREYHSRTRRYSCHHCVIKRTSAYWYKEKHYDFSLCKLIF